MPYVLHCTTLIGLKVDELLETARMLFTLVLTIKEKLGISIELVNLGGGFGIPYRPDEQVIDVKVRMLP